MSWFAIGVDLGIIRGAVQLAMSLQRLNRPYPLISGQRVCVISVPQRAWSGVRFESHTSCRIFQEKSCPKGWSKVCPGES